MIAFSYTFIFTCECLIVVKRLSKFISVCKPCGIMTKRLDRDITPVYHMCLEWRIKLIFHGSIRSLISLQGNN